MSWITVLWSMMASACLTLAAMQFVVWLKQPAERAYLLFTAFAVSVAGITSSELLMMHAPTPVQYGTVLRWIHVPVFTGVLSCIGFIHFYFRTGRRWLRYAIIAPQFLAFVINFVVTPNLQYKRIDSIEQVAVPGGETVSIAHGVANPLVRIEQFSLLLLVVFIVDSSVALWRRGGWDNRRKAGLIGGSLALFIMVATVNAILTFDGVVKVPIVVSIPFMVIVVAMGYELSADVVRASTLAQQLRSSEGELRASEDRMSLAAEAAGVGVWIWDISRGDIWATQKCRELYGVGLAEPIDVDRFFRLVHPDDRESLRLAIDGAVANDGDFQAEYRVPRVDGDARWIDARGHVKRRVAGETIRMHGVSIDITERKLATERIRHVVEASPSAMLMADQDGRITLVNAQVETVFGYTREELIGRPVELLLPETIRAEHLMHRRSYMAQPASRPMGAGRELFGRRKDGSEVPIEVGLNPIREADGLSVLASITDITARKQSEKELSQQRNELAHLSRVTMLGELSGSLAHELNQPLTSILSNAQAAQRFLAHDVPDLKEVREILADIVDADRRAGEVIRRLRLLLTKGEVQHVALEVNEVIQDVLRLMRSDLINQGVHADVDLTPGLPTVRADRVQLQQVVLNLVVNACDAMSAVPPVERRLSIKTDRIGEEVRVAVSDRGCGIPVDRIDRIFEPFFTTKTAGMGLGLAVCRTIITAHDGRLWASNNDSRGATVHFSLPLDQGAIA